MGQNACIAIAVPGGKKQFIHGIMGRFRQGQTTKRFTAYYAELYPRLWLLTKTSDSRIFQNKSVPDIVKQKAVGAYSAESSQNVTIKAAINLTQEAGAALKSKLAPPTTSSRARS